MKRDLYTSFFTVYGLVMTFDGLVMQGILSLENKSAIVKSTRKLSKNIHWLVKSNTTNIF